jgi:hypothetical protein
MNSASVRSTPLGFGFRTPRSQSVGHGGNTTNLSAHNDHSEGSANGDSPDMLSVFKKKNHRQDNSTDHSVDTECTQEMVSLSDSPTSVVPSSRPKMESSSSAARSSSTASAAVVSTTASASSMSNNSAVWRWHADLVAKEATRSATIGAAIQEHQTRYQALREIVSQQAVVETSAACRWTMGIAHAQTTLAASFGRMSLAKPLESDDDLTRRYQAVVDRVTEETSLPEKPLRLGVDVDEIDSEVTTQGADNGSVMEHIPPHFNEQQSLESSRSETAGPPVSFIAFPNPHTNDEALGMLHKQHVLLSETLVRHVVSPAAKDKVQLLHELCRENATTLEQVAGAILSTAAAQEETIQQLWSTYSKSVILMCCLHA